MVLMGRVLLAGRVQSWLHVRLMMAPRIMVVGMRVRCVAVPLTRRAMCGVARPMNVMGPQKAVVVAVIRPARRYRRRFMRRVSTPRFLA